MWTKQTVNQKSWDLIICFAWKLENILWHIGKTSRCKNDWKFEERGPAASQTSPHCKGWARLSEMPDAQYTQA